MRILAFESSAKAASAALLEDGVLTAEAFLHTGLTHSRTLLSLGDELLRASGLTARDVDACACAAGPGSFTGVRIGVAAAKGFAWGLEKPCYGVSTLYAMARNLAGLWEGVLCPAMDARRSQVYNALFLSQNGQLTRLREDRALSLAELSADLQGLSEPILLIGDGAALCARQLNLRREIRLAPEQLRQQRAAGVALAAWELAQQGAPGDAGALTPSYLRPSQAERERQARLDAGKDA